MTPPTSIPGLSPQLLALADEFSDWWAIREKELDTANEVRDPLYHYTDMAGLVGIVSSETIRFTSVFHLNDPSELAYGLGLTEDILKAEFDRGADPVKSFCKWTQHVLVKGAEIFGFFVASFSQANNDLAQWRAYADNGRGVAIGLSPTLFRVLDDQSELTVAENTLAAHVVYDRDKCRRNFNDAIQRAVRLVVQAEAHVNSPAQREAFGRELTNRLVVPIYIHAATCKHHAYAHERETRLLIVNQLEELAPVTEVRTRGSTLVPFIPSRFRVRSPGAITEIMIGPAAAEHADDAVRAFLRRQKLPLSILCSSEIPYTAQ
jgi:hypothetical protein